MTSPQPPALELSNPLVGPWTVRHSPADRVPSHGTELYASALAVDLVPVDPHRRTAPVTVRTWFAPEPPTRFPGFGRTVLAPAAGQVLAVVDGHPDHAAHRGVPSIVYALGQGRRAADGWAALAGNHIMLAVQRGPVVALCHLRRGSLRVAVGQQVRPGVQVAQCGNSGNSMEPHLHIQAMSGPDPITASPVAFTIHGRMPHNGEVGPSVHAPTP